MARAHAAAAAWPARGFRSHRPARSAGCLLRAGWNSNAMPICVLTMLPGERAGSNVAPCSSRWIAPFVR